MNIQTEKLQLMKLILETENPKSPEKSDLKQDLHRCVITKQTTIFYQFNSTSINVITIFDTRMNPKKLKTETK